MVSSPHWFFEKLTQFVMIHEVDCRSFPLSGTTLLLSVTWWPHERSKYQSKQVYSQLIRSYLMCSTRLYMEKISYLYSAS
jgi:hypothetical protein